MVDRVLVGDLDDFVDEVGAQNLWDEARADALNLVRTGLAAGEHRTLRRLDRDGLEATASSALMYSRHAGDRAAGADAGNENVDLAVGVVPDFGSGGFDVNLRVGGVVELLQA